MEKDIAKIQKNDETEIIVRLDDFGGRRGLTIREFVKSERYTGFTKAGTRIPGDKIAEFKEAINSISEEDMAAPVEGAEGGDSGNGGNEGGSSGGESSGGSEGSSSGDTSGGSSESSGKIEEQAM